MEKQWLEDPNAVWDHALKTKPILVNWVGFAGSALVRKRCQLSKRSLKEIAVAVGRGRFVDWL